MSRKRFLGDHSGNATVLFAISLPVLLAIAGAATLYTKALQAETRLQAALGAGVLARTILGVDAPAAQRIKAAHAVFQANISGPATMGSSRAGYDVDTVTGEPIFTAVSWEVSGQAITSVENPFSFVPWASSMARG